MHAERLLRSIRVQSLVSISQPFPFRERVDEKRTDEQTDVTECYTLASGYTVGMGNNIYYSRRLYSRLLKTDLYRAIRS